jgi:adenine/guanine phosphoribosyltransferase-like PRPP-binding protein
VSAPFTQPTTGFWQALLPPAADKAPLPPAADKALPPFRDGFPVTLPDGRRLLLPLRALPDGNHAVASLIATQMSFDVGDAIIGHMAALARPFGADCIVGLPTLGLCLAPGVAQRLEHQRYVALGYSRKYWYDDALSIGVDSITSPGGGKRLYLDPNQVPLIACRRVLLIDDAISTGRTALAAINLVTAAGGEVAGLVVAMKQTRRWITALDAARPNLAATLRGVFGGPLFALQADGWHPIPDTDPPLP